MVQAGTLFAYLAAFITVVLALALSDLLISAHRLLRARTRVVWRPLPLVLAVWVLLLLLTAFFEIWALTRWEQTSYYGLVWLVGLYFPIFLAACAVLPDEVPADGLDLGEFYFRERRYVVSIIAVGILLDMADTLVSRWDRLATSGFFTFFLPLNLLLLAALAMMAWSARKWVHWVCLAILFGVACLGFSRWAIRGVSAMTQLGLLP